MKGAKKRDPGLAKSYETMERALGGALGKATLQQLQRSKATVAGRGAEPLSEGATLPAQVGALTGAGRAAAGVIAATLGTVASSSMELESSLQTVEAELYARSPPKEQTLLGKRDFISPAKGSPPAADRQARVGIRAQKRSGQVGKQLDF